MERFRWIYAPVSRGHEEGVNFSFVYGYDICARIKGDGASFTSADAMLCYALLSWD